MNKILLLFPLLLVMFIGASAQTEYGNESELKGLTKVFIDTGTDIKNRKRIIKMIEKSKTDLTIVNSLEDAEIVLGFGAGSVVDGARASTTTVLGVTRTSVQNYEYDTGQGVAAVKNEEGNPRFIWSFESKRDRIGEPRPAKKFAKEFIKLWKKINKADD